MKKPTYYLWKNDFTAQEEFEAAKETFRKLGFRVVTFLDGQKDKNIHDGLNAVIQNHICGSCKPDCMPDRNGKTRK